MSWPVIILELEELSQDAQVYVHIRFTIVDKKYFDFIRMSCWKTMVCGFLKHSGKYPDHFVACLHRAGVVC